MSMLEHAPASAAAGRGGLLPSVFRQVATGLVKIWKARRGRQLVKDMRDFDDAQLADIGLTRGDVEKALSVPFPEDPSFYLVRARQNPLCGVRRF
jgi:uncharacterized protein YjiS (DUF1127 family)